MSQKVCITFAVMPSGPRVMSSRDAVLSKRSLFESAKHPTSEWPGGTVDPHSRGGRGPAKIVL